MKKINCWFENLFKKCVGFFLLLVSCAFFLIGVSELPVVGVLLALPPLATAYLFLAAPPSKACALH